MKPTPKQRKALVLMWEKQTNEEFDPRTFEQWCVDNLAVLLFGEGSF